MHTDNTYAYTRTQRIDNILVCSLKVDVVAAIDTHVERMQERSQKLQGSRWDVSACARHTRSDSHSLMVVMVAPTALAFNMAKDWGRHFVNKNDARHRV